MEENKNYYAIIPANVRYDTELKDKAKLLYGEITALCNEKGYCWATNDYFAKLYGVSKVTISLLIKNLIERGYIHSQIIYKEGTKEILNRYLSIVKDPIKENLNRGIKEKLKDNNTYINNTNNNILCSAKDRTTEKKSEIISSIIDYMNNCGVLEDFKVKKTFKYNNKSNDTVKHINARLAEGNTLDDFKDVIYYGYHKFIENEFKGQNGKGSTQYYRPSTLFSPKNFENYKNEYKQHFGG